MSTPSLARARAISLPIPRSPPVTSAHLPSRPRSITRLLPIQREQLHALPLADQPDLFADIPRHHQVMVAFAVLDKVFPATAQLDPDRKLALALGADQVAARHVYGLTAAAVNAQQGDRPV